MIQINLYKTLRGGNDTFTLCIEEKIKPYSFTAIFGKSGVGKSTLLRILAGLEFPDKGNIKVNDDIWWNDSRKEFKAVKERNIGFVTQQSVLFPNMTVKQQLTFSKGKNTDFKLLDEVVNLMEIENLMDVFPNTLSGGQRQRVAIARAIIQKPTLLLLDEPFTALDYEMRQQLINLTKKVAKQYKMTTFLISHHPIEIEQLATEVWIMKNGNIVDKGIPTKILKAYK